MRVPVRATPMLRSAGTLRLALRQPHLRGLAGRTMPSEYDATAVEAKWQTLWRAQAPRGGGARSSAVGALPPKYVLSMFPYPSGSLHMGHVRVYSISDTIARYNRMKGFDVLHPMGWDAFGLPAENAAMERGVAPDEWTRENIAHMREQLDCLGFDFDWDRAVSTCDPGYYRWTQWLFLRMMKHDLAYQAEAEVNWDPVDKTVLANEQVDADGRSWRSGALVEKKLLKQWFVAITKLADSLLDDLDTLTEWPPEVLAMQKQWIGRTKGTNVLFNVESPVPDLPALETFTTRVDTLHGVTYVAVALDHPLVVHAIESDPSGTIAAQVDNVRPLDDQEVEMDSERTTLGVSLGCNVIHPLSGEPVPVFAAPYVIGGYGTGAVMGVPAHDQRDFMFAETHKLPVKVVVAPADPQATDECLGAHTSDGVLVNSGPHSGLTSADARTQLSQHLADSGLGSASQTLRLRDWLVSRQRYWGVPIPVVHCPECGPVPVPEAELPVELPPFSSLDKTDAHAEGSPLSWAPSSWLNVDCPSCGTPSVRDTDTLDTFVDSSWYYARYTDAKNSEAIFDKQVANHWMPVDVYVGGIEHAVLHLLYARFVNKFMKLDGLLTNDEPFKLLLAQGMVVGNTIKHPVSGAYLKPHEIEYCEDDMNVPYVREAGRLIEANQSWEKMSKSKYNGVDPAEIVSLYGADTARLFILFKAPPPNMLEWDVSQVAGQQRWVKRIWAMTEKFLELEAGMPSTLSDADGKSEVAVEMHLTIKAVTGHMEANSFNVAIAELMKFSNMLQVQIASPTTALEVHDVRNGLQALLLMLAPLAPHVTSELWTRMCPNSEMGIVSHRWPEFDENVLSQKKSTLVIQINGKTRGTAEIEASDVGDQEKMESIARSSATGVKYLSERVVKRTICVGQTKAAIVNFVLGPK